MNKAQWLRLGAYLFLVIVVAYSFWVDHQQDVRACHDGNEALTKAVLIGARGLIESAPDADPEAVDRYLANLDRRLAAAEVHCT